MLAEHFVVLQLGGVEQKRVSIFRKRLKINGRPSDNIAMLRSVRELRIRGQCETLPHGVSAMPQLTRLVVHARLAELPSHIGNLSLSLRELNLECNRLVSLPPEIGDLYNLQRLVLSHNMLRSVPKALITLPRLESLLLDHNRLWWLPHALEDMPMLRVLSLNGNKALRMPHGNVLGQLRVLFPASVAIGQIRDEATEICVGLQDLHLPALVTLEIVDAALPNSIPMHKKWDLITAVKHFHQRHGLEATDDERANEGNGGHRRRRHRRRHHRRNPKK